MLTDGSRPEPRIDQRRGICHFPGAVVKEVVDVGPVTTYGQNDMVLDNWGSVETWTAKAADYLPGDR